MLTSQKKNKNKLKIAISTCLIIIIVFLALAPFLKNGFIRWDDDVYVTKNTIIKSLSFKSIKEIFTSFYMGNYHPMTMLSYLFEYHLFKLNPLGYHSVSLLLHLLNCVLIFFLILLFSAKIPVALITAILWGLHPLNVDSLAWISENKGLLSALFYLSALMCYVGYSQNKQIKRFYYGSLLLFVLALLSKPTAISLPLVLFLIDYLFKRKISRAIFVEKIPFFILAFVFSVISVFALYSWGGVRQESWVNLSDKVMIAGYCIIFYCSKILIPLKLSCLYPYPARIVGILPPQFSFSLLIIILIVLAVFLTKKYTRKIVFGCLFFLISILPALQFVPISTSIVANRYIYVASIGLFYIFAEGFVWLYRKSLWHGRLIRTLLLTVLSVIMIILGLFTQQRCRVWKDDVSLWSDVINNYPDVALAYNNRAVELLSRQEYQKAHDDFLNVLRIDPYYDKAYFNLGCLFSARGDYSGAIKLYNRALELNPNYAGAYLNLCRVYGNLGNFKEALVSCQKAAAINPKEAAVYYNLALIYYYMHRYDLAVNHCDIAFELGYEIPPKFLEELKTYRKM